jgi:chemotaxis protein methyltransferase CheR
MRTTNTKFSLASLQELTRSSVEGELPLADAEFNFIREFAMQHVGIEIADYKRNMVRRRISKRLRAHGLRSHEAYCDLLRSEAGDKEVQPLINALTTNKTDFFRESHHFDHLAGNVAADWKAEAAVKSGRRIRIWSAGCSTGQEPYSIAMCLIQNIPAIAGLDLKILATDIDTEVLKTARAGVYNSEAAETLPPSYRTRFMEQVAGHADAWRILSQVRSLITFNQLNLHGPWPMRGAFDIIFCRNVVIYFDKQSQRQLFNRFADLLPSGGLLYCGHSESLFGICSRFRIVGKSIYEKIS